MDTRGVRAALFISALAAPLAAVSLFAAPPAPTWNSAVAHAARFAPQARIVVLDVATGHLLAASRLSEAARTLAAPGSTLKPLVLYSPGRIRALESIAPHRLHAKTHSRRPLAQLLSSSRRTHGCSPGPDLVLQHLLRYRCGNAGPRRTPQSAGPNRSAGPDWARPGQRRPPSFVIRRLPTKIVWLFSASTAFRSLRWSSRSPIAGWQIK